MMNKSNKSVSTQFALSTSTLSVSKRSLNQWMTKLLVLLVVGTSLMSCTSDKIAGGSTDVETGGIAGVAKFNPISSPISDTLKTQGTEVIINRLGDNLLADSIATIFVDAKGNFEIQELEVGTYNIEFFHSTTAKRNLVQRVKVLADTIVNVSSTLHTPGSIVLKNIPDTLLTGEYSVYIPSLRLQKSLSVNSNSITLDSISAGVSVELRYAKNLIDQGIIQEVTLNEDEDITIDWP